MKPIMTYQRCRKSGELYGPVHGANNVSKTICGKSTTDAGWYVLTNNYDGEVTCKACLRREGKK